MMGFGGVVQSFEHCPQGFEHSPKPSAKRMNRRGYRGGERERTGLSGPSAACTVQF